MRYLKLLFAMTALLALVAVPALAQTAPPPASPPAPPTPEAIPPETPAGGAASPAVEKQVEGPVKRVDAMSRTIQVGWFLGLFRTTLELTDATQIVADGRPGSLFDIQEGAKVKAAYETRDGKNVAKSVEVMPEQAKERAAAPAGSPAGEGARMGPSGVPGSTPQARPTSQ